MWGTSWEQFGTKLDCYQIIRGLHNSSFWGIWGNNFKKVVSRVQQDRKLHIRRVITSWRLSHGPANSGPLRNRSGDVPQRIWHKPGNKWGRVPEWSSSWSRHLPQSNDVKLGPRRSAHGDMSSRGSHLLVPQYILGKGEKEPLYQSTAIAQWEYPCDDRSRPNFVGPSGVGIQQKFCTFPWQYQQNFQIAKIAHDNDAHVGREIWKDWAVRRYFPHEPQNS